MIFSQTTAQVLNGDKTQTRRPARPHDRIMRYKESGDHYIKGLYNDQMKRMRYQIGKTYAVQAGRGKHSIGRIRLLDIRLESLYDLSLSDAMAEGILPEKDKSVSYPTSFLLGFIQTWIRLYPTGTVYAWENNPKVVVLEFERVKND